MNINWGQDHAPEFVETVLIERLDLEPKMKL